MAKINLSIPNLEKAIKQVGKFRIQKIGEIVQELDRTALMVESGAKRNLTNNKSVDTGRLRSSVVRQEYGQFNRTVGTNVEYAASVEFGTAPHVIRPKNAKALKTPFGFFKKVNHPGSRAKPFLFPAAEAERNRFVANLRAILSST